MRRTVIILIVTVLVSIGVGVVFGALVAGGISNEAIRQMSGKLTESEARLVEGNERARLAETRMRSTAVLNVRHQQELDRLRRVIGDKDLEIARASEAVFSLSRELTPPDGTAATTERGDALAYQYTIPWFAFSTPNVYTAGGEKLRFDLGVHVAVLGLRIGDNGVLVGETIDLRFVDQDGNEIEGLTPRLTDYSLDYVPDIQPDPRWYDGVGVSSFLLAAGSYPVDPFAVRAGAGLDLRLWVVNVLAWGEWEMRGLRDDAGRYELAHDLRAWAALRYTFWSWSP